MKLNKVKAKSYTLRHASIDPEVTPSQGIFDNVREFIETTEDKFLDEVKSFWKAHDLQSLRDAHSHPKVQANMKIVM